MKYIYLFSFLSIVLFSCSKQKIEKQAKIDDSTITSYLTKKNLTANKTSTGIYYIIEKEGSGVFPKSSSQVRVEYKGYYSDDAVFDFSDTMGVIFGLQNVIKGWTEGITYFKEGSEGKLFIPSALAYGPKGSSNIPGNSVLIFDIKLLDVY
jgi:FKBP-type peptidyl-prolyl cis-trans isomerase